MFAIVTCRQYLRSASVVIYCLSLSGIRYPLPGFVRHRSCLLPVRCYPLYVIRIRRLRFTSRYCDLLSAVISYRSLHSSVILICRCSHYLLSVFIRIPVRFLSSSVTRYHFLSVFRMMAAVIRFDVIRCSLLVTWSLPVFWCLLSSLLIFRYA